MNSTQIPELVITAYRQTKGRGRHYETWVSESGGLYFSIIYKRSVPIIQVDNFTRQITEIIKDALEKHYSSRYHMNFEIRGVNDLYLNNKKLAGVLIESFSFGRIDRAQPCLYIIGIGINVNQEEFPNLSKPATSLFREFCKKFSRYEILKVVCHALSNQLR
jgi:BirA family biotin operon repressor/biotin-[acetyl-CoA-carboxylase] ligase